MELIHQVNFKLSFNN